MNRPTAYSGNKPYVFISYAHKDANRIYPLIQALQNSGLRIWYDEGLEVGSHWSETIATHLDRSHCVLCFLTKNFFESENCKDEMHFAKERGKGPLIVYLDSVKLPVEMQMSFGRFHALSMDKLSGMDNLIREICRSDMLAACREGSIPLPKIQPVKVSNESVNAFFGLVQNLQNNCMCKDALYCFLQQVPTFVETLAILAGFFPFQAEIQRNTLISIAFQEAVKLQNCLRSIRKIIKFDQRNQIISCTISCA
mgnify:CR=1 FL=1